MGEQNAAKALFLPQLYCQMKKPATAEHLHGAKHAKDPKKKKKKSKTQTSYVLRPLIKLVLQFTFLFNLCFLLILKQD